MNSLHTVVAYWPGPSEKESVRSLPSMALETAVLSDTARSAPS